MQEIPQIRTTPTQVSVAMDIERQAPASIDACDGGVSSRLSGLPSITPAHDAVTDVTNHMHGIHDPAVYLLALARFGLNEVRPHVVTLGLRVRNAICHICTLKVLLHCVPCVILSSVVVFLYHRVRDIEYEVEQIVNRIP